MFLTDREISADRDIFFIFSADLSNMYQLLKPIHGGLGVLIQEVETHIKNTGLEAVKNLKGENVSYTQSIKGYLHTKEFPLLIANIVA